MSFESELRAFVTKTERISKDIFVATTVEVRRSIVEGSELTSAPGQPVDTGSLRASWTDDFTSSTTWQIGTRQSYAKLIEENGDADADVGDSSGDVKLGVGRPSIKSTVGGHHSVKLTRAGWQRIVSHVQRTVT